MFARVYKSIPKANSPSWVVPNYGVYTQVDIQHPVLEDTRWDEWNQDDEHLALRKWVTPIGEIE